MTGGAGYVGSALVPKLLAAGHRVTVLDLYIYGREALQSVRGHPGLREVEGDIRDVATVRDALGGCDSVIHLACISNDPSFELNPELGRSINHSCFRPMVRAAKDMNVERFIYASSSSVYGIKDVPDVDEDMPLEPLTDYSKFKALCEAELSEEAAPGFVTCTIRPATVCGYAPRQRLDVIVNILTNHAVNTGRIKVFGGSQLRPNINIEDMADLYLFLLDQPDEKINGKIFNAGYENHSLLQLAAIVKKVIGDHLEVVIEQTDDLRSYHISSEKLRRELGFTPRYSIDDAVRGLVAAMRDGRLTDTMTDARYFNIKRMQQLELR